MSSTPRLGFQKRPQLAVLGPSPLASISFTGIGARMLKTQKQDSTSPPHLTALWRGSNGTTPRKPLATHLTGKVITGRTQSQAICSHASFQASARGQRQTRLTALAGAEGRWQARRPKREGVEAAGARHAARQREEGARSRRPGASTQAQGRARGWRLLSVAGDTAR